MSTTFLTDGLVHVPPLSLSHFSSQKIHFYSKTRPPQQPSSLSSMLAPFSDPLAASILLGLSVCTPAICMILNWKLSWELIEAILLAFSALLGKACGKSGNWKFLLYYEMWLLLTGFLSMAYTNILQSIVVVPAIRYTALMISHLRT